MALHFLEHSLKMDSKTAASEQKHIPYTAKKKRENEHFSIPFLHFLEIHKIIF